ncbi:MAG TPA: lamin tail domain-containing protein, partial [Candidatus Eisenbacteria bacterium]|nr:lamin tail domain-containing protein [Candidatus Eisenbacteria bacterium]
MRSFPRSILLALAAAFALAAGRAESSVRLNEVLYDPMGEDAGAEFVELWNAGDAPVPLAGLAIEAGDGARPGVWSLVFAGAAGDTIQAGAPFLVDGARLLGALQNGPDAARLADASGATLDLLGWGALADPSQYEGAPAADAESGWSLARREDGADTDRNADDWEAAAPTPGRANRPARAIRLADPAALLPEVVWPGEPCAVAIEAVNAGREPLQADGWGVTIALRPRAAAGPDTAWVAAGAITGSALAPGAVVSSSASFVPGDAPGVVAAGGGFEAKAVAWVAGGPFDSSTVAGRVGPGAAVVNEVAFRDAGAGEWVELLALEAVTSWDAYAIGDATGASRRLRPLAGSGGAEAGAYRVVAADAARFLARFAIAESLLLVAEGGWLSLNDGAPSPSGGAGAPWTDVVRLLGAGGVPCDAVPYDGSWSARGGSIERLSARLPSASPRTWSESAAAAGGTPGAENSIAAPGLDRPAALPLLAAPSRVLRRGVAGAGALVIEIGAGAAGRDVRLAVLDMRGRTRRVLADGVRFGGAGALVWDGRDAEGAPLPPGIYVVRLEASSRAGEAPRRAAVA